MGNNLICCSKPKDSPKRGRRQKRGWRTRRVKVENDTVAVETSPADPAPATLNVTAGNDHRVLGISDVHSPKEWGGLNESPKLARCTMGFDVVNEAVASDAVAVEKSPAGPEPTTLKGGAGKRHQASNINDSEVPEEWGGLNESPKLARCTMGFDVVNEAVASDAVAVEKSPAGPEPTTLKGGAGKRHQASNINDSEVPEEWGGLNESPKLARCTMGFDVVNEAVASDAVAVEKSPAGPEPTTLKGGAGKRHQASNINDSEVPEEWGGLNESPKLARCTMGFDVVNEAVASDAVAVEKSPAGPEPTTLKGGAGKRHQASNINDSEVPEEWGGLNESPKLARCTMGFDVVNEAVASDAVAVEKSPAGPEPTTLKGGAGKRHQASNINDSEVPEEWGGLNESPKLARCTMGFDVVNEAVASDAVAVEKSPAGPEPTTLKGGAGKRHQASNINDSEVPEEWGGLNESPKLARCTMGFDVVNEAVASDAVAVEKSPAGPEPTTLKGGAGKRHQASNINDSEVPEEWGGLNESPKLARCTMGFDVVNEAVASDAVAVEKSPAGPEPTTLKGGAGKRHQASNINDSEVPEEWGGLNESPKLARCTMGFDVVNEAVASDAVAVEKSPAGPEPTTLKGGAGKRHQASNINDSEVPEEWGGLNESPKLARCTMGFDVVNEAVASDAVAVEKSPAGPEPTTLKGGAGKRHQASNINDSEVPEGPEEREEEDVIHVYPGHLTQESEARLTRILDRYIDQPDFESTIQGVSLAIFSRIMEAGTIRDSLDIFDERTHPFKQEILPKDYFEHYPGPKVVYNFVSTLFAPPQLTAKCAIVAMIFLDRILRYGQMILCPTNWKRILLGSVILTCEYWSDEAVRSRDYCELINNIITADDMHQLERYCLRIINFDLDIPAYVYDEYDFDLRASRNKDLLREFFA